MAPDDLVQQINVEIDGLKDVAATLRKELEAGLRTQVTPVHDAMATGARIGGCIPGWEWISMQNLYSSHIERMLDALYNIDKGTQAVANAADAIARAYGDSDAFAQASADEVREVISYVPPPPTTSAPPSSMGASFVV
jgi:hypothetical protein